VSESGATVNEGTMLSESAVWCAIMFLASNIASLPCPVLESNGRQRVKKKLHYLHQRLNVMANPEMTAMTWRESCIYYQALWGTAYSIIERDNLRRVTALWPVHPENILKIERKNSRLKYTVLTVDHKEIVLDQEDVLRVPGVGNGLMGLSMMEKSRDSIGLILAMRTFANLFFKNGANLGVIFKHPETLGDQAYSNLKRSLENAYSGLGRSHRVMLAEEGMDVSTVGVEPEKSQLLEARQFSVNDVARWFNLPPHVLKDLTNANYSNMQQQSLELVTYTFRPWFVKLEQSYEAFLLRDFERGKLSVRHNANALMRGDEQSRAEYYRMMFGVGAYSPNRILELEDENPIEEEWADKTYVQLNLVPTHMIEEVQRVQMTRGAVQEKKFRQLIGQFDSGTCEDRTDDPNGDFFFAKPKDDAKLTDDEKVIQGIQSLEREHRPILFEFFSKMVQNEVDVVQMAIEKDFGERSSSDFIRWLDAFYSKEMPGWIKRDFGPVLKAYADLIARESGRMIGLDEVMTDELVGFVTEYLDVYATRHCGSSIGQLKKLVEDAAPDEVVETLLLRTKAWLEKRPDQIADDEAIRVANAVARETWRQNGVVKLKWVAQGSKACPFCKQLNGKIVGIKSPFLEKDDILTGKDANGNHMRIKGRKGHPPIHKGCVCAIVPVDAGNRLFKNPYEAAKQDGGQHHGAYIQLSQQSLDQVKRSEKSFQKNVSDHLEKIKNPESAYPGFQSLDERRQAHLLEYWWPSDVIRNRQMAIIANGIIKERES